jgi:hypothetical protein
MSPRAGLMGRAHVASIAIKAFMEDSMHEHSIQTTFADAFSGVDPRMEGRNTKGG